MEKFSAFNGITDSALIRHCANLSRCMVGGWVLGVGSLLACVCVCRHVNINDMAIVVQVASSFL